MAGAVEEAKGRVLQGLGWEVVQREQVGVYWHSRAS